MLLHSPCNLNPNLPSIQLRIVQVVHSFCSIFSKLERNEAKSLVPTRGSIDRNVDVLKVSVRNKSRVQHFARYFAFKARYKQTFRRHAVGQKEFGRPFCSLPASWIFTRQGPVSKPGTLSFVGGLPAALSSKDI